MSFPSNAGAPISLEDAAVMTKAFRTKNPDATKCWLVEASLIQDILNQTGCAGLRMYNAINETSATLVIVGVDGNGNDMSTGKIVEELLPCPKSCSADNPLNC